MKMGFVLGAGVGFVLGSRAGRGPYEKLMEKINGARREFEGEGSRSHQAGDRDIVLPTDRSSAESSTNPSDLVVPSETTPSAEQAGGPGLSAPGGYEAGRVPTPGVNV